MHNQKVVQGVLQLGRDLSVEVSVGGLTGRLDRHPVEVSRESEDVGVHRER